MNKKIIIEMGGQIISIEFSFSFPTIYHNVMYANGKVPPKIMLLYGGKKPVKSYIKKVQKKYSCTISLLPITVLGPAIYGCSLQFFTVTVFLCSYRFFLGKLSKN